MNKPIDLKTSTPIFHQIKNLILSKIASKELKPHDQLPSEREYEALLGASRQTVRRALDELVLRGVLYRQPGKGTYVSDQLFDNSYVGIVGSITLLATSPEHTFHTKRLEQGQMPEFASNLLNLSLNENAILFEQLVCVRGEPRYIHRSYISKAVGTLAAIEPVKHLSTLEILVSIVNQLPLISRDHLKPELCNPQDAAFLGIEADFPVQAQRGVILSANGLPVEAHEMIIRGDKFKLDFEFSINQQIIDQFKARQNL
ncbi:MAG: GntR family transcriptional regulator [Spirochaetota bacterium]